MKRVLLLANPNSVHTYRWATTLNEKGLKIAIYSLEESKKFDYANIPIFSYSSKKSTKTKNTVSKIINLILSIPDLKRTITVFNPDIIHAHYATSYGLLGSIMYFKPFLVSVWGSDVYLFPKKSYSHESLVRFVFKKADQLLSTSEAMAVEGSIYTNKQFTITPFGVDLNKFKKTRDSNQKSSTIVIGTVKALEHVYGIDLLIMAFKDVVNNFPNKKLLLKIAGEGSKKQELQDLVSHYNLDEYTEFAGKILNEDVPSYLNKMDIFVNLSRSESFGVAVVEALACELPVVVSDTGGLPEVVQNGKCGLIVPSDSSKKAGEALSLLIKHSYIRQKYGAEGRKVVEEKYDWIKNTEKMLNIYNNI